MPSLPSSPSKNVPIPDVHNLTEILSNLQETYLKLTRMHELIEDKVNILDGQGGTVTMEDKLMVAEIPDGLSFRMASTARKLANLVEGFQVLDHRLETVIGDMKL